MMKVFMSWSGQRSKLTAELLYEWIKCVIQAAQPWISSKGIERGALWFSEISNELKDTTVGIVCLTKENKNAPWILFEAGALARGLSTNRVCTLLVDLAPSELQPPLAEFNHTFPNRESMWSLITTLNSGIETYRLELPTLQRVFDTYWPQFERDFAKILEENPVNTVVEPRKESEMLAEILDATRSMAHRIRDLESKEDAFHDSGRKAIAGALKDRYLRNPNREILHNDKFGEGYIAATNYLKTGYDRNYVRAYLLSQKFSEEMSAKIMDLVYVDAP
jgi:hypothetical protein